MSIIIAIIIFGIIVLVHEFGHFIVARKCGVYVEEFAIGMGPKLFGVKRDETLYSIRLFPIGGYCKMLGEDSESDDMRSFSKKKVSRRAAIASAGAFMNFLLAFVAFFIICLFDVIAQPVIGEVIPGTPAQQAGLIEGDRFTRVNGMNIHTYDDFSFAIYDNSSGKPVSITVRRDGQNFTQTITPKLDEESGRYIIGFYPAVKAGIFAAEVEEGQQRAGLWETVCESFFSVLSAIKMTLIGITRLVTMRMSLDDMSGPIGIVQTIGTTYNVARTRGLWVTLRSMLAFMAMISANIGVFNLMPLPALDGGRLVFLTIEGIRKRPVNPEREGLIHFIGFVALMLFAVFIAFNDLKNIM